MRLIKPYATIVNVSHLNSTRAIDNYGRTCYKSEQPDSEERQSFFVRKRIKEGHLSIIEHCTVTVGIVCDRGVSHELVRHRLASFSQESTRYCNYGSDHVTFIIPCWMPNTNEGIIEDHTGVPYYNENELRWLSAMAYAENFYKELLDSGWTPQQARSVLPNSLKTELIMTANLREWRHIFELRCAKTAHPQMREIMIPLLCSFFTTLPDFFHDLYIQFCGGTDERKEPNGLA